MAIRENNFTDEQSLLNEKQILNKIRDKIAFKQTDMIKKQYRRNERFEEIEDIYEFCKNRNTCRRFFLLRHLDDVDFYKFCDVLDCNLHCDNCYDLFSIDKMSM